MMTGSTDITPLSAAETSRVGRYLLAAVGFVCVGFALVGIIVPGLPTTVFALIAAWAFARSCPRFGIWLENHPRLGPCIRAWRANGAVPVRAKVIAVATMCASLAILTLLTRDSNLIPLLAGSVMAVVAVYILTRPNA